MKQVPNYLTLIRLLLVPVFVVLMVDPTWGLQIAAVVVFIVAALTDYFDGILARRFGAVSDIGKLLDPLADKLLIMAALVMLVGLREDLYGEPWVPAWMVFMVLAREIWITGIRGVAATKGLILAASNSAKVKSVLQMVAIVFLLLHNPKIPLFGMMLSFQFVGLYLLLFSILMSYWSAYHYTKQVFEALGLIPFKVGESRRSSDSSDGQ